MILWPIQATTNFKIGFEQKDYHAAQSGPKKLSSTFRTIFFEGGTVHTILKKKMKN